MRRATRDDAMTLAEEGRALKVSGAGQLSKADEVLSASASALQISAEDQSDSTEAKNADRNFAMETRDHGSSASKQHLDVRETLAHGKMLRLKAPDPGYFDNRNTSSASNMRTFHVHFPLAVQLAGLVETQGANGLSNEYLETIGQTSLVLHITETVPAMTNEDGKEILTEVPCVAHDGSEHACSSEAYTPAGVYSCPEGPGTDVDVYVDVATCSRVPSMLLSKLPKTLIFAHVPTSVRNDALDQLTAMAVKLGGETKMIIPHPFYNDVVSALDMPHRNSILEAEDGSFNIYRHTCKWTAPCGNRRRVSFCWPVCCNGSPCR